MSIRKPAVVTLLLCLAAVSWLAADPAEPDAPPIMKEAEDLVAARERIGKELMAIVAESHDDVPIREAVPLIHRRIGAARLLGEMQYMPAIDTLIRYVDLVDPTVLSTEARPDLAYPITLALAAYGNAAIPQIIDTYLAERISLRHELLAYAIRFGDSGRHGERTATALRYLRGAEPPDDDDDDARLKKQNMQQLEERLEWFATIVVAPDHARD